MDIAYEYARPRMYRGPFYQAYLLLIFALLFSIVSLVLASSADDLTTTGVSALKSGNYRTATTDFYQVLSLASTGSQDYHRAEYYLARSFVELGNLPTAQTFITALLQEGATSGYQDGALYYQMRIGLKQNNFTLLSTSFVQLTTAYPQCHIMPSVYLRYAEGFRTINHDYSSAINYAQKVVNQYPNDFLVPGALVVLAAIHYDYYKKTNDPTQLTQCQQALDQCLAQYPNTFNGAEAQYWKGYLQQNAYSNWTGAIQAYQTLINLWSMNSVALQPTWQTGYSVDSLCMEAQWQIARGYSSLNDAPDAVNAYQQFIQYFPNSSRIPLAKKNIANIQSSTITGIKP